MSLWNAKMTDLVLTAQEPAGACVYWAGLLGGKVDGDAIALGAGTRLRLKEGSVEGLAEMHFDASAEIVGAARAAGATEDGATVTIRDADNWLLRLNPVGEVSPLMIDGVTLSHVTLNSPEPP